MKLTIVAIVLCSLVAFAFSETTQEADSPLQRADDAAFGKREADDILLDHTVIQETAWKTLGVPFHHYYNYENKRARITRFELKDTSGTQTGAAYYQIEGGVGKNYLKIDFKTKSLRGVWYDIDVYGVIS